MHLVVLLNWCCNVSLKVLLSMAEVAICMMELQTINFERCKERKFRNHKAENTGRHNEQFSCLGDLVPRICRPLVVSCNMFIIASSMNLTLPEFELKQTACKFSVLVHELS